MNTLSELKRKFRSVWPHLDERTRRIMAANEAVSLGYGGVSLVRRACGLSRKAIAKGIGEIQGSSRPLVSRVRRPGAGRKPITQSDPRLVQTLEGLIDEQTRGDPESALRWICKSTRAIARELDQQKHPVSHMKVAQILHDLDYSLQSNRKTEEGADHPDRDAQFRHINAAVKKCLSQGSPVISVDTKKKELVGNYDNAGRQWLAAKQPRKVQGHDFPSPAVPRAYPYGIYDIGRNAGFVNVGTDHDTGAFAVASIRGWWRMEGRHIYPHAKAILITGRRRRKQRVEVAVVEAGIAEVRRSDGIVYFGLPLSSRHQQMEQDRAPSVFLYLVKLARGTIARLRNGRPSHRQDNYGERIESHLQIGSPQIPDRTRGKQCANGAPQPGTKQVSW